MKLRPIVRLFFFGLFLPLFVIGLKNGWYPGDEGWRVSSVGVVRPKGRSPYAIAIMTDARESWREGIELIEGVAEKVNSALRTRP